jgi:hypothetical protein
MFGPAPVTTATFPASDTSKKAPLSGLLAPPGSEDTIYDTFSDEKRVI